MERRTAVALSATAHGGVLLWALVAGLFPPAPNEDSVSVAAVSVVSSAEFDALVSDAPDLAEVPAPAAPVEPEADATPPPAAPAEETAPPVAPPPDALASAAQDVVPDTSRLAAPEAEVASETPPAPASPADAPDAAISDTPAPREADIVTAVPTPAPPPLTETAPVAEAPATPAPAEPETPPEEAPTPAAPEATAPVIVTEDMTPARAPERSPRPNRKPAPPVPVVAETAPSEPEPAPEPEAAPAPPPEPEPEVAAAEPEPVEPAADPLADAIAGALAEAAEPSAPAPSAPSGPPLTQGERDGLRVAVSRCWNLGSLSTEAMGTTVTIFMSMTRDGLPQTDSLRLTGFSGGSEAAAQQAYEAGRRAILQCGRAGFDLPAEKYEQWREIEMTFNPDEMRTR
ncbi:hypothetical protein [uncultured Jannaschia sp.]|uniref:hypothetical protein n=1 Tax=uncultured Jannaschia sp. TaxID=293347 RepID=UPI002629B742|nr:hypothetical protein [uncultured Jannaschia sp.]